MFAQYLLTYILLLACIFRRAQASSTGAAQSTKEDVEPDAGATEAAGEEHSRGGVTKIQEGESGCRSQGQG